MVLVKVCGITNLDDGLAAADAGADALGFNFYPRSPRYITPAVARTIVDHLFADYASLLTVGVFVNESLDAIKKIAAVAGVSALQLHGNETPEYCKALEGYYLIKAFSAGDKFAPETVLNYNVQATGSTASSSVPDAGSTLSLMGLALLGIAALRRKAVSA